MSDSLNLGPRGEALAWNFLRKQGYSILEKNYRIRLGEIDVIARKKEWIAFIEVKTRLDHQFGTPGESINWRKQRKLTRVAQTYLQAKGLENQPSRFDVLSITWNGTGEPVFDLLEDAFTVDT